MKNLSNMILKYLYYNDNSEFIDIYKVTKFERFKDQHINTVINDMKEYLDKESIYESRGLLTLSSDISKDSITKKLCVRINQQGRERYENIWLDKKTLNANKKIALFTILGVVVTLCITLLPELIANYKHSLEVIPSLTVKINNNTNTILHAFKQQEFYLWLPNDLLTTGTFEIIIEDDELTIPLGQSSYTAKILNNDKFYSYFKSGDSTISLSIRTENGLTISDDFIPFSQYGFGRFYTSIDLIAP